MVSDAPRAMDGRLLGGKYRLFASLGRGGMADVVLGVAQGPMGFNKLVVIKRLRSNLAAEQSVVSMFLDEARLAARLNHGNVVHTYEVGEQEGVYYIAMEYLEGQPLSSIRKAVVERGLSVPPIVWARIIADALKGLHYAHELCDYDGTPLHVIHRDVSPQNIFVTYDGTVKLVDFGIAKAMNNSSQTQAGILKGKAAYMAPEQITGAAIDRRADIFAMGIVLWELLANQRLFSGEAATALHKVLNMPIPTPSAHVPGIPLALDAIVMRALERQPDNRFQSAHEMRQALELYLRSSEEVLRDHQIDELLVELFAIKREEQRRRVERYMQGAGHTGMHTASLPAATGTIALPIALNSPVETQVTSENSLHNSAILASAPPKRPYGLYALLGLLSVALLGVGVIAIRNQKPDIPPAAATTPPPPASPSVAQPARVTVRLRAQPREARLLLDDVDVGTNPYEGFFPRDGLDHRVRVVAPGHMPTARLVRFDGDVDLTFSLTADSRDAGDAGEAVVDAAPRPVPRGGPITQPTTTATATNTATGVPTATQAPTATAQPTSTQYDPWAKPPPPPKSN